MFFVTHLKDGDIVCKTLHAQHQIKTYIEQNNLVEKECKIFDGNRMSFNTCYQEWDHAIIVECSHCNRDMTGYDHGKFPCSISLADGCPDKSDGGW